MRRTGLSIWSDLKDCTAGCQDTSQRGGSIRFIVACLLRAIIISIVNDQDNQVSLPSRKGPNLRMVICKQYKSKANFRFKGRSSHMYQNGCAWTLSAQPPHHGGSHSNDCSHSLSSRNRSSPNPTLAFRQSPIETMISAIWNSLDLPAIALVQGASRILPFSSYHQLVLQIFTVFAPFYISVGTSLAPDRLDLVFLIAIIAL
jgi:hypothetical protein